MPRPKSGNFNQKEYQARYEQENLIQKKVCFNRKNPDDMALMEWATMHGNFTTYIKRLIYEDMVNLNETIFNGKP